MKKILTVFLIGGIFFNLLNTNLKERKVQAESNIFNDPLFNVTEWKGSDQEKKEHLPLKDLGEKNIIKENELRGKKADIFQKDELIPPNNSKKIVLIVENGIYSSISSGLDVYQANLQNEGYTTSVHLYSSGTPEDLRGYLYNIYLEPDSLQGVILIGDIPYAVYENNDYFGGAEMGYTDFPTDIFYMDLNGNWLDNKNDGSIVAGNGKYDGRSGDIELEIWAARIKTSNLPSLGTETELINSYFSKNNLYRQGNINVEKKSLLYVDDDWQYSNCSSEINYASNLYREEDIDVFCEEDNTTASDYKTNRMTDNYELVFLRSHGTPYGHGFYESDKNIFELAYNSDYRSIDPKALFYHLFVCSGADYSYSGYLAGTIAFNNENNSGLVSWGSTKTGGMLYDNYFYSPLGQGKSIGESFVEWFNVIQGFYDYSEDSNRFFVSWSLGMTIIGDATLGPAGSNNNLETIIEGNGQGKIINESNSINCTDHCSFYIPEGESITLTAEPYSNSLFSNWSGCDNTNGNECTLVGSNRNKVVTASFEMKKISYTLKINLSNSAKPISSVLIKPVQSNVQPPYYFNSYLTYRETEDNIFIETLEEQDYLYSLNQIDCNGGTLTSLGCSFPKSQTNFSVTATFSRNKIPEVIAYGGNDYVQPNILNNFVLENTEQLKNNEIKLINISDKTKTDFLSNTEVNDLIELSKNIINIPKKSAKNSELSLLSLKPLIKKQNYLSDIDKDEILKMKKKDIRYIIIFISCFMIICASFFRKKRFIKNK